MKKFYEKHELIFAILSIVAYVVLFSAADEISALLGIEKVITAVVGVAASVFWLWWLKKHALHEKYGLCKGEFAPKTYLYFLPLALIVSVNLWGGVALHFSWFETVLYIVSMLCVGFLEELIFRGFLFVSMRKDGLISAMIVSSLTFGIGHIINLLSGAEFIPTLLQICYATAAGFLFTVIFHKSGNLLPCMIAHGALNALSAFQAPASPVLQYVTAAVLTVVPVLYALWVLKNEKKPSVHEETDEKENA